MEEHRFKTIFSFIFQVCIFYALNYYFWKILRYCLSLFLSLYTWSHSLRCICFQRDILTRNCFKNYISKTLAMNSTLILKFGINFMKVVFSEIHWVSNYSLRNARRSSKFDTIFTTAYSSILKFSLNKKSLHVNCLLLFFPIYI